MPPTSSSCPSRLGSVDAARPRTAPTPAPSEPPLTAATILAVVDEAANDVIAKRGGTASDGTHVVYVRTGDDDRCSSVDDCMPLGRLLDVPRGDAGHLHRSAGGGGSVPGRRELAAPVDLSVLAELVAVTVARDLLDVRLAHRNHDVENLRTALESNRLIGVAMGVLMATQRCTATQAFESLKTAAQNQNRKLRDIASEVQDTGAIPEPRRAG